MSLACSTCAGCCNREPGCASSIVASRLVDTRLNSLHDSWTRSLYTSTIQSYTTLYSTRETHLVYHHAACVGMCNGVRGAHICAHTVHIAPLLVGRSCAHVHMRILGPVRVCGAVRGVAEDELEQSRVARESLLLQEIAEASDGAALQDVGERDKSPERTVGIRRPEQSHQLARRALQLAPLCSEGG